MSFDKLAHLDRMNARAMAARQALREEVATNNDVVLLKGDIELVKDEIALAKGELRRDIALVRGEVALARSDLLAAMKADKPDRLKGVVLLIVGQAAVFVALKLLGY